ncbi:putative protein, contains ML domain [Handroanthus impetiginosus]|uniref:MD-2-related lipid-recognition domain-containing protein n=1 Tax=Handroanthus impetiginosus TaxID=429701 RepID=A0A2G9FWC9_9LAMI|nr:putative protein, contains ML domain [Handroanthus impetiginosus]
MAQLEPLVAFLFTLCLLVPLISSKSIDVEYCDENADYAVKVSGVEISPYPVSRGKKTTYSVAAYADKVISGGKLKIDVSYFGFHVHNENHDLCKETSCPVSVGEFVLSHTLKLPGITPPVSICYSILFYIDI